MHRLDQRRVPPCYPKGGNLVLLGTERERERESTVPYRGKMLGHNHEIHSHMCKHKSTQTVIALFCTATYGKCLTPGSTGGVL